MLNRYREYIEKSELIAIALVYIHICILHIYIFKLFEKGFLKTRKINLTLQGIRNLKVEAEAEAEVRLSFDKTFCNSSQRSQRTRDGYPISTQHLVPILCGLKMPVRDR